LVLRTGNSLERRWNQEQVKYCFFFLSYLLYFWTWKLNLFFLFFYVFEGLSCRQRWFNQLDPKINKRNFTDEEEEKLLRAHILYGNKWSKIAKLFNRRTDHAVKNHWHSLMNRIIRKQSASDIRSFDNIQNYQTSNFLPGLCLLNTKQ